MTNRKYGAPYPPGLCVSPWWVLVAETTGLGSVRQGFGMFGPQMMEETQTGGLKSSSQMIQLKFDVRAEVGWLEM